LRNESRPGVRKDDAKLPINSHYDPTPTPSKSWGNFTLVTKLKLRSPLVTQKALTAHIRAYTMNAQTLAFSIYLLHRFGVDPPTSTTTTATTEYVEDTYAHFITLDASSPPPPSKKPRKTRSKSSFDHSAPLSLPPSPPTTPIRASPFSPPIRASPPLATITTATSPSSLPTLYKKSKLGRTQVWNISLTINNGGVVTLTSSSGLQNGKMKESSTTITLGKNIGSANETTAYTQGLSEMQSRWNKQKDRMGYSISPQVNSAPVLLRPMLLHEYRKNASRLSFGKGRGGVWVQEKLDGSRAIASISPSDGSVSIMSRQGAEFSFMSHIREAVKALTDGNPTIRLDGELFCRTMTFNEIQSACKNTKTNKSQGIALYVFDLVDETKLFEERYSTLRTLFRDLPVEYKKSLKLVDAKVARTPDEVDAIYEGFVENGAEGVVVRNGSGKYTIGTRSHDVLKYKPQDDAEFLITGFKEGRGKDQGKIIFELVTADGKPFDARPALSYEERTDMFKNGHTYVGKQGTVKYMGETPDGIPRFPIFKGLR
jgi:hypothetical protein